MSNKSAMEKLNGHGKVLCNKCGKTIVSCRCVDCPKNTLYDTCDDCEKVDPEVRSTNVCILEKGTINDPVFDLVPGKHGHVLGKNGGSNDEFKEVTGTRVTVPMLGINARTLFQLADFLDDMDGTFTHSNVTIVIKEADKEHNTPAKIGAFAI